MIAKICKRCVMSNRRAVPQSEYSHSAQVGYEFVKFDDYGVCSACNYADAKKNFINWSAREAELIDLLDKYRSSSGSYDVLVPGSGGKDSCFTAHVLKSKYGMHPLTVTWAPHMYTDIGRKNHKAWIDSGFDNILITPNGKVHRMLTREAFVNILHPFQPFVLGQRMAGLRIARKFDIGLVFHGESPYEYGFTGDIETVLQSRGFDSSFYSSSNNPDSIYMSGIDVSTLIKKLGIAHRDLELYLPLEESKTSKAIRYEYLGYYLNWDPQEVFYYAARECGFLPNSERSEGTYSRYASLDDKIDCLHYYCSYIKFGIGRATMDAAQEIRNGKLTRDEGIALVKKFDGEFPRLYFKDCLDYMGINLTDFLATLDRFRSPDLWFKDGDHWKLKSLVDGGGD